MIRSRRITSPIRSLAVSSTSRISSVPTTPAGALSFHPISPASSCHQTALSSTHRFRSLHSSSRGSQISHKVPPHIDVKALVACRALETCLQTSDRLIGIGSGSTVVELIHRLANDRAAHQHRLFVPTSYQTDDLLKRAGLPRAPMGELSRLDICFDGADSISRLTPFWVIKGGGGCLLQEKIVMTSSDRKIIMVDESKLSPGSLGGGAWNFRIPLEVIPCASELVFSQLSATFPSPLSSRSSNPTTMTPTSSARAGGSGSRSDAFRLAQIRQSPPGSGKLGPIITDNGNFIIDLYLTPRLRDECETDESSQGSEHFQLGTTEHDLMRLHTRLKTLVGVVETGLFGGDLDRVFIGKKDGSIEDWSREDLDP